jgi:uncharacterized protein
MIVIGFLSAILIGFTLGLIGGGGSILTVPVLVYLFGIDPVLATGYSLFVVGISSAVGTLNYMKAGLLNYRAAFIFAVPSLVTVYATRKFLMPIIPDRILSFGSFDISPNILFLMVIAITLVVALFIFLKKVINTDFRFKKVIWLAIPAIAMAYIMRQFVIPALPENIFEIGGFLLTKSAAIMIFFSLIMFASAFSMIRNKKGSVENKIPDDPGQISFNYPLIVVEGAIVGTITGIVGAGGGFLIIPALVLLAKLPMKLAVGTSLLIIASKSLIGFMGDISNQQIEWPFLLGFTGLAVVGIFVGTYTSRFLEGEKLKRGFGWFVLIMALYIMAGELVF